MRTFSHLSRAVLGTFSASLLVVAAHAQTLSQTPLLTKSTAVPPNLMMILDDSGSMQSQFLYQFGGTGDGYGMQGPALDSHSNGYGRILADCPSTLNIDTTCTYDTRYTTKILLPAPAPGAYNSGTAYDTGEFVTYRGLLWQCVRPGGNNACASGQTPADNNSRWQAYNQFFQLSPDVNRLTYDPRTRYNPRLTGTGSNTTTAATPVTSDFYVFFYGAGGTAIPKRSKLWDGTSTNYGNPVSYSSYFAPYTALDAQTNLLNTDDANKKVRSTLASDADTTLFYPQCVGTCTGVPSAVVASSGKFPKFANRTDCTGTTGGTTPVTWCTLANEQQNYANWKKFNSNRSDMVKTGMGYAFQYVDAGLRLGWSVISETGGTTLGASAQGVGELTQSRKTAFYNWLYSIRPTSSTPLRVALDNVGRYFSRSDNFGPWATNPVPTNTNLDSPSTGTGDQASDRTSHFSCRRSYAMMLTDGYWNGGAPTHVDSDYTSITNSGFDKKGNALPNYVYDGISGPYAKQSANSNLADIAMKYWINDLRAGTYKLKNNVPQIKNTAGSITNPSFWQNMGFYAVGLGLDGTLPQTSATLASLTTTPSNWPNPISDDVTTIDDMWHASINGRGSMLSAKSADELADGVESMLAEINRVTDSSAGVAASTASLLTGTRKYSPLYTTGLWTGNVVASDLDAVSAVDKCIAWQVVGPLLPGASPACTVLTSTYTPPTAYTQNGIPAHGARYIYAWNGSGYGEFKSSNSYVTGAVVGGSSANLINYLRGDYTNEDNGTGTNLYRKRDRVSTETVMGDIVNSTPTLIQGALDAGYAKLPAGTLGQATYKAFVAQKALREGVLFAGSNDGMLHGFRNSTGQEVFAFVPKAVMPNLHKLAQRSYNHQYYVDGPTTEVDACFGPANTDCTLAGWKNLLLGSLGAGGQSIFALDVTTFNSALPTMGLGASNILWEITTSTTGYANLGHTMSAVQTGVTQGGKWVAIFGNGPYGADGGAHLYVADLQTGAMLKDIDTLVTGGNGLSAVTLVRDNNMRIIGAYAGDLKGNLWKFDLSNPDESQWKLAEAVSSANNGKLFAPASGRPITAPPAYISHPLGGRVVVFGTGKFFDEQDTWNIPTQGFKGIWDKVEFGVVAPDDVMQSGNSNLVAQTTTGPHTGTYVSTSYNTGSEVTQTVSISAYKQSNNTIDWNTKRGWYMEIPTAFPNERLIYPMARLFSETSRLVLANTLAPSTAVNPCDDSGSGSGHSYVFDLLTGGRPAQSIIPDCPDCTIFATPPVPPTVICNGANCFSLIPTEPNCTVNCAQPPLKKFCGAQTGIPCPTSFKRSWRQLFMR